VLRITYIGYGCLCVEIYDIIYIRVPEVMREGRFFQFIDIYIIY